ncbi:MAG: hypothetical protein A3E87_02340 [Gammaproteobacteria bacterium RIFCSPHIGHO2_12_FULL_35_23]|nr:MAG: hypothetical protein A3E87_02340 [Gammaproteobacteria bacterium RIFCSPHIGHO2_12_FULL_35_23]
MAQQPHDNEDQNSEYQFKDDQNTEAEYNYVEEPQVSTTSARPKIKVKPIITVILIIIVLFIVYKVIHSIIEKRANSSLTAIPTVSIQSTSPVPTQQSAVQNNNQALLAQLPDLATSVASLQASNQDLANKIQQQQFQDQTNMTTMQQSIDNVSTQMQKISDSVSSLSAAFYKQQEMQQRAAYEKAQVAARKAAALRNQKNYFVDAVIPGRAWLKGADGSALTVAVGDELPGYGKVIAINPYSGEVRTTSSIIPYATSAD